MIEKEKRKYDKLLNLHDASRKFFHCHPKPQNTSTCYDIS